jgi:tetratricopeptide (TPR) repeat protein
MKKIMLIVLANSFFGLCGVYGQTFKDVFRNALDKKDMQDAKEILLAWDYEDRNDPELYPSYFNYYTIKSMEKDTLHYDRKYADSALYYISMGIDMFPTRFDMRVAKIYMLSKLKEFDKLTDETILIIKKSKEINNNWKGQDYSLIDAAQTVMEGAVQEFQEILFAQSDTALYDNIERISKFMIQNYPGLEKSWVNLSTLHLMKKEYDKSLEALKNGEKVNPKNAFLLYNMAVVYKRKGDKTNAIKYFQLAIDNVNIRTEAHLRKAAEDQLKQL